MKKVLFLLMVILYSCSSQKSIIKSSAQNDNLIADGKLFTSLFQQQAAEYKALCFQAYNIASLRLNEALKNTTSTKPNAVITDIDETVLDNSPYAVHQALMGKDYSEDSWMDWTSRSECDTLSGALTFFKYAASKNVEVFYITNRDEKERKGTLANLQKFGFPYADDAHLILKTNVSSKEPRRQQVAATHNIILFLGDNLADFSSLFDHKTMVERTQNVQNNFTEFGKKFIVLPNANYGDWESALYRYNYRLTPAQKDSVIKSVLKNY